MFSEFGTLVGILRPPRMVLTSAFMRRVASPARVPPSPSGSADSARRGLPRSNMGAGGSSGGPAQKVLDNPAALSGEPAKLEDLTASALISHR
jgi:hypothetical protein